MKDFVVALAQHIVTNAFYKHLEGFSLPDQRRALRDFAIANTSFAVLANVQDHPLVVIACDKIGRKAAEKIKQDIDRVLSENPGIALELVHLGDRVEPTVTSANIIDGALVLRGFFDFGVNQAGKHGALN